MYPHVFLRYVPPEFEVQIRALGFRKYHDEAGHAAIWMLDDYAARYSALRGMDTKQVGSFMRSHPVPIGEIYEADMWGMCPD